MLLFWNNFVSASWTDQRNAMDTKQISSKINKTKNNFETRKKRRQRECFSYFLNSLFKIFLYLFLCWQSVYSIFLFIITFLRPCFWYHNDKTNSYFFLKERLWFLSLVMCHDLLVTNPVGPFFVGHCEVGNNLTSTRLWK